MEYQRPALKSIYLSLIVNTILNENKILVDSLVKKYYNQDYEMWLNPTKYLNKKI